MSDILLVYPRLGSMDSMVVDPPLSILYAAADSVKQGFDVRLLDLRCEPGDWRKALSRDLALHPALVGVSVMTGKPLENAREVSRQVRAELPSAKVVWGGPHVTVLPETIEEPFIDYLVRGYGSKPLAMLAQALRDGRDPSDVPGLSYKDARGVAVHNRRSGEHEMLLHADIPYSLLPLDQPAYRRAYNGELMFTLFSAMGCPYQCAFCVHPAVYRELNAPRWRPLPDEDVVEHIAFAVERYGARNICFLDDTSFPSLGRMRRIFQGVIGRGLDVCIEFRGARINELDRMDDDFIRLMIRAGTRVLKVGAESASDRLLVLFKKGITREQILRVNEKFARYPEIVIDYNFFCGAPGETYEDLVLTKNTVLELVAKNPNAYYSFGSDWKPIPGSALLDYAVQTYGYKPPRTMDEWIEMDSFDSKEKIVHPWYTARHDRLIQMMQLAAFVVDNKIARETASNTDASFKLLRVCSFLYRPLALWRLRHDRYEFLVEFALFRMMVRIFPWLRRLIKKVGDEKGD